jgi:hypothetical protein
VDGTVGEVDGHGTYEEDGPVTWEALMLPRDESRPGRAESPISNGPCVLWVHATAGKEEDTRHEVGQRQGEPEPRPMGIGES